MVIYSGFFFFRIEFLIVPAVALALLINHEFTVLEVSFVFLSCSERMHTLQNHTKGEKFASSDICVVK